MNGLPLCNEVIVLGMTWQVGDIYHAWFWLYVRNVDATFWISKWCSCSLNHGGLSNCIALFVLKIIICAAVLIFNSFFFTLSYSRAPSPLSSCVREEHWELPFKNQKLTPIWNVWIKITAFFKGRVSVIMIFFRLID